MALEDMVGPDKFLDAFNKDWPVGGEAPAEGDDHIRGVKNCLLNSFGPLDRFTPPVPYNPPPAGNNRLGAVAMSFGATADRPATPASGDMRWNSEENKLEIYRNGAWEAAFAQLGDDAGQQTFNSRMQFKSAQGVEILGQVGLTTHPYTEFDKGEGVAAQNGSILGGIRATGRSDVDFTTKRTYGRFVCEITDAANQDGRWQFITRLGGSFTARAYLGAGYYAEGLVDPGLGGVNAVLYQRNNVQTSAYESVPQTLVKGQLYSFEHGLGGRAKLMQAYLQCATAADGWSVGDEFELPVSVNRDHGSPGGQEYASFNTLYTDNDTHIKLQITAAAEFTLPTKTGGFNTTPTLANYNVIVRASGW